MRIYRVVVLCLSTNKMEELTDDILSEIYSGIISNDEILPQEPLLLNNESNDDEEGEVEDIIVLRMDIRQPLSTLRTILEQRVGVPLKNFDFWLQNAQMLESHKNLVDQGVQGEGIVQIMVQVITITRRINIVVVLKPTEETMNEMVKKDSEVVEDPKTQNSAGEIQQTIAATTDDDDDIHSEDDIEYISSDDDIVSDDDIDSDDDVECVDDIVSDDDLDSDD